jgi:acetylornithine/succinyldiaminopimelate/putrescine aminotransferase
MSPMRFRLMLCLLATLAGLSENIVKEARGRGMLLGLELYPHERLSVQAAYRMLLEYGFVVGYYSAGNVLRFDPALTIDQDDITHLLESLDRMLNDADSGAG